MVDPNLQHNIRRQKQIRLIMAGNCRLRRRSSSTTTEKRAERRGKETDRGRETEREEKEKWKRLFCFWFLILEERKIVSHEKIGVDLI